MERKTIFSNDRIYRYTLWRDWTDNVLELEERDGNNSAKYAMFIGLNPSTADENKNDPTIRRLIGLAKAWGYGALCMTNLFAFRATDPEAMKSTAYPIGESNEAHILHCAREAGIVVAAWGKNGRHRDRSKFVMGMLSEYKIKVHHLGLNGDGTPKHPLYLKKDIKPIPF